MNPCLGNVTCPHCGNKSATVHRERTGKKGFYYRCYEGVYGVCGTVQIRGPGGQKWIEENMRPLGPEQVEKEASEAAGAVKAEARDIERQQQKQQEEKPKGFFATLLSDEE